MRGARASRALERWLREDVLTAERLDQLIRLGAAAARWVSGRAQIDRRLASAREMILGRFGRTPHGRTSGAPAASPDAPVAAYSVLDARNPPPSLPLPRRAHLKHPRRPVAAVSKPARAAAAVLDHQEVPSMNPKVTQVLGVVATLAAAERQFRDVKGLVDHTLETAQKFWLVLPLLAAGWAYMVSDEERFAILEGLADQAFKVVPLEPVERFLAAGS